MVARSPAGTSAWQTLLRGIATWAQRRLPQPAEEPPLLDEATLDEATLLHAEEPAAGLAPLVPPALPEGAATCSATESGERLQTARPLSPEPELLLSEEIARVVADCRAHVLARIRKANDMTSREVLAVGRSLDDIVGRAQSQVQATRAALDTLSGANKRGVTELIEEQGAIASTRFAAIRSALQEQNALTRRAMQASSEIAKVGAGVSRVAFQARLLSLNANIEAARFGDQGGGFQVIANEMRRLTDEIDRANRQIEGLASALLGSLPKINQHADELCRHADAFTEELVASSAAVGIATTQLRTSVNELLASGDQAATQVLSGSHDALSHLQFQDPTAQSLLIIDADLARLAEHLIALLQHAGADSAHVPAGLTLDLRAANAHRSLNAGAVAALDQGELHQAGEILLF